MFPEEFIIGKGFNSTFSLLKNFELAQNPTEEGFLSETASLVKRKGLFTDLAAGGGYNWETDGDIMGKIIVGGVAYFWTDKCNVYKFYRDGDYVLEQIYVADVNDQFFEVDRSGKRVKQKALKIPYLSKKVNTWTADKVLSTNDDNGDIKLVVNESNTFDINSVGQYIYFDSAASDKARGQIRQVVEFIDDKTVLLANMFYGDPTDRDIDETGATYEEIGDVIVFNNIRNTDGQVLTIDVDGGAEFRDLGGNDIELFEGRYRYINSYGTSVGGSIGSGEYEILDPDTIRGSGFDAKGQKMDSLILTKNYLLVNQENSVSVIWQIAETESSDPIFNLNSIINGSSAFSPDAIYSKGGLYFLNKDRVFEAGDIVAVSSNIIYGETKNQGQIIQKFLNEISDKDFVTIYDYGRGPLIQYIVGNQTRMLVYDSVYEGRLFWEYEHKIYDKFEMFYGDMLIGVGSKVCLRRGDSDLDEHINAKLTIIGSTQYRNTLFSLKKINLSLGYYENIVKFKVRVDLGGSVFESKIEKDADGIEYLTWHNVAGSSNALGMTPIGFMGVGGENGLKDKVARIGLVGIPIGKKCSYYKISFENIENYDLNISGITVLVEGGSPYITPYNNVI